MVPGDDLLFGGFYILKVVGEEVVYGYCVELKRTVPGMGEIEFFFMVGFFYVVEDGGDEFFGEESSVSAVESGP